MTPPPIQIFLTTIASQPALRQRQEYILRILQAKSIPFDSYDLASDEEAKRLWRRKAPIGFALSPHPILPPVSSIQIDKQQLPGILVGGVCPGNFTEFEEAVEFDELDTFLRRNDSWDSTIEETRPPPPVKPIGVPGAASPSQMARPEHKRYFTPSPQPSPAPLRSKGDRVPSATHLKPGDPDHQQVVDELRRRTEAEFDIGEELSDVGLQGVKVTEDDLLKLVEELGLEGDEANELAKGLGGFSSPDISLDGKAPGSDQDKIAREPKTIAEVSEKADDIPKETANSSIDIDNTDGGSDKRDSNELKLSLPK